MQAKPWDADTMPLNEPSAQIPPERPLGLLEHEKETGTEEIWARRALVLEASEDGGCRGKQSRKEGRRDGEEGESAGRSDVERAEVDAECEVPEEEASAGKESEPLGSALTDRQDASEPEEGEPEGTSRADGCEDEEGGDGEIWRPSQEGENGTSRAEEAQDGVSVEEEEGVLEGRHGERGKKKEEDDGGQARKDGGEPHGDEGGRNGNRGQETGLEWDLGSQAQAAGGPEEEASSASSGSVMVSLGARHHGPSKQEDDDERSGNPSLQSDSPAEAQRTQAGKCGLRFNSEGWSLRPLRVRSPFRVGVGTCGPLEYCRAVTPRRAVQHSSG
uniref:Uncharacterized protein n=1 Tax=Pogona vitticeps TaxID=103695 RepID=A0ABM5F3P1_9SAUR